MFQKIKTRVGRLGRGSRNLARNEQGAELVELAFIVPFFLVMIIGIVDFGGAWAARDQVAGAAQAAARVSVNTFNDTTNPQCGGNPCTVQAAVNGVIASLNNAGVPTCGMDPANITAAGGAFSWSDTASCGNGGTFTITVARAVPEVDTSSGTNTTVLTTQVTISYPYTLVINMPNLAPFTNTFGPYLMLNRTVTMANLS
ncbi:MAG TPA: TadE/TadG family type IV pilus assembly protein [Candidatus Acidoferrales bacterium]|nr:TadE/TadG family type IV pilus assembly protein [Candidatus Acidoferrales bacterium]